MSKLKQVFWLITIGAGLLLVSSCKNPQSRNTEPLNNDEEAYDDSLDDKELVMFLLPSPGEILERFHDANIKYNPELINSPGNKDKYIDSKEQALNLGVYITDMAYVALFNRSTETVKYLEAIQSLSSETGISSSIFESLVTRSTANAGKLDSLVNISEEAFNNMFEFLELGGRENTIAQISAGSYIESLYIALQSVNTYSVDSKIIQTLAEMKYPMDNLQEKANKATLTDAESSIIVFIKEIVDIFNDLDTSSSKTVVTTSKPGTISIQGGQQFTLSEKDFNALKIKVSEVRNNIVK